MVGVEDIERIYRGYVRVNDNPEYLERYVPLPLERNTRRWQWEGKDFPRVIAVLEFERLVRDKHFGRVLVFNGGGDDPEVDCIQPDYTLCVDYNPATEENDLHTLDLPQKLFDLILLGQTLEHLYDPILALFNLFQHLTPGGYLFTSAPVINISHSTPFHHYTGFTPTGLGCMCSSVGFDILHIGQWGNREYIRLLFGTRTWPDYLALGDDIHNEFDNPVCTWILARRPM